MWLTAGALTFWAFGYTILQGSDLWWHVAAGRHIVENLGLPRTDPWSFTAAENRWVIDAWLSDVLLFLWSRYLGLYSLVWWKWSVVIATFLLLMRLLWRLHGDVPSAYLAATLGAAVAGPFMDLRPQLHSLLCFVLLLDLTLDRKQPPWTIVLLFGVWANLHAGFTLGFLMLPVLLAPFVARRDTRPRAILIFISSVAVCLINPNGYRSLTQPFVYALDTDSPFRTIGEWHSPFAPGGIHSPLYPYAICAFGLSALFLFVLFLKKQQPLPWRPLAVGAIALAMSLTSRRFVSVFAISQALILAPALAVPLRRVTFRHSQSCFPVAALALGAALLWPYPQRSWAFHYLTAEYGFPHDTVAVINANRLSGNVFAYYNWGGYLHLKTDGRLKVHIDGRASAVFDEETYLDYLKVLHMRGSWVDVVEGSGADYFLWPNDKPDQRSKLLATGRWSPIHQDTESTLLVRKSLALPAIERPAPTSVPGMLRGCFGHLTSREYSTAESCCKNVLDEAPYHLRAWECIVQSQAGQCRIQQAEESLRQLNALFPQKAHVKGYEPFLNSRKQACAGGDSGVIP